MSAQEYSIINATVFNPETDMNYKKPTLNKSGGKSVGVINSKTSKSLYLSTPLMLTWGVNEWGDEVTGRKSYDLSLQFPRDDYKTPQTTKFLEAVIAMEDKIKADAVINSKEWLNKTKMSAEVVEALFHPMLRYRKDKNTGEPDLTSEPTFRVKLDYWENEFKCEIYDMDEKLVFPSDKVSPMDLIPKATNVAVVLRCGGLWFANGKFGCTWRLEQAVVKPRATLKGKCHIKLENSDRKTLMAQSEGDGDEEEGVVVAEDSDEEDPSFTTPPAPAPAPAPAPPPAPKKKVVRRKKVSADST
jgi:hypothetical protein